METSKPHVVVLASPGMGHVIPLLELSKRLVTLNNLEITLFVLSTNASTAQSNLVDSSSSFHNDLHIVDLSPVNISDLMSTNISVVDRIFIIVRESIAILRSKITSMKSPPSALIVDIFGIDAFDMADQLGIPKYVFVTSSAWFLALTIRVPTLDQEVHGEYIDLIEPIQIPGCKPIRPCDVADPMLDRTSQAYQSYLDMGIRLPMANGLFLNTWEDLEPQTLNAFKEDIILRKKMKPRLFPVGPLVRTVDPGTKVSQSECLDWLKNQPSESVLYVSFGSGGTLSPEQMTELAWGLELSQQRFIWVVRPPIKIDVSGNYFSNGSEINDPSEYLPDGFLTRIHGLGIVVPNWAQQEEILAQPSTGGFLTHCGWNSTLESIINGVPMIAWPLYAEQRMNATMLVEDLGVAVRSEMLPVISRDEIEKMVRLVIEGKEGKKMRDRVRDIKNDALKATAKDGSSYQSMIEAGKEWEIRN